MEVICKEKYNVIFWRDSHGGDWNHAEIDELIHAYEDEPFTELELFKTVRRENTDIDLYYAFKCKNCDEMILTVDANHGYQFCPHCGAAVM